jgi:hypothetical protein
MPNRAKPRRFPAIVLNNAFRLTRTLFPDAGLTARDLATAGDPIRAIKRDEQRDEKSP